MEKYTEKTEKRMRKLDKITASPSAKINDKISAPLDKVESRMNRFKDRVFVSTVKLEDRVSSPVSKVQAKTDKFDKTESTAKLKVKDEASGTVEKVQSKFSNFSKFALKKIAAIVTAGAIALGGLGIGSSVKTFANFEQGLSNVKAVTQATDIEMKVLKDTAKELGAATAWSAVEVTQAEELLGQAGFSVKETTSALPGLLSLASAGGLDLATATDIASGTLRAFNIDASQTSHVADVLALSASATNSDVTDLGETMKYAAPVAQALGISFEDTASAAGLLSNANIKGSQAGTILRQAMARLASPTKEAAGAMDEYGINAFDAQGNMKPLSDVIDNLNSSLGELTSQERADVISTIFGTESMSGVLALMNQGGQSLGDLSRKLKETKGAADEMAETKLDNLAGQCIILQSAVEGMKIELGERLAPYAKEFVTWFTAKIPDITTGIMKIVDKTFELAHKFNELSPSAKKSIGVLAGGTLVIGPLSKGINTLVTGLSGFVKVGKGIGTTLGIFKTTGAVAGNVTKVATATNVASKAMGGLGLSAKASSFLLSPWTIGIAAAGVGAYKLYKHLSKDALPAIEEFGEGLSKSTAEGMNAYRKLDVELGASLMNIKIKSEKITEETATAITGKFAEMGNTIHQTISQKYSDTYKTMEEFFAMSGAFTDEKSNEILNRVNEKQAFEEEILQQGLQRINEIYRNAAAEHREITSQEQIEVNNIRQNMMNQMVENISQTSAEQQKILGQLAYETTALTAEQAAKVVEDSKKAMDEAINAATEQADKVIESARYQRDVLGTLKPEEAQTIISAAESQKEYAINAAQGMHEEVVMHAQEQAQDHVHEVDWETGQVRDKFDAMMEKIREFIAMDIPEKKIVIKEVFERVTNNINESYKENHNFPGPSPAQVISAGPKFRGGKANGIGNTSPGNYEVAEKGFEIVVGKQTRLFKGGERILNNKESRKFLQQDFSSTETQENTEKPKMNFSVAKPQLIAAGGNNSVNVEVENNFQNNYDIDSIVKEATTQFAYKLKQALSNIKK
ncbi:phage tail tape measure protein [Clostridium senegalense]|uniref:phage tail tape measure protein n=1 Tax=Clostridium senegalense TaxID=1465809 RepID=UPI0002890C8F|nr:phage tail tape measure protein [Clostridium senegalense]